MTQFPTVRRTHRGERETGWMQGIAPWPDDARCVVCVGIDFDGPSHDVGQGYIPYGSHSTGRYSARRGVPRYLDLLDRLGVPATFFVPGYDAECYPQTMRDIVGAGHEIGAHGYLHERTLFPPEEETRRLRLTHDILADLTGVAPVGWRSPSGQKTYTTLNVLRDLGYRYDASDKDFDMPYLLSFEDGGSMIELPNNTCSLDDFPFYHFSMTPVSEVLELWKREFDVIYGERGFYFLSIHPRSGWGSGTPTRALAVEKLLRYAMSFRDVSVLSLAQLADWVDSQRSHFEELSV